MAAGGTPAVGKVTDPISVVETCSCSARIETYGPADLVEALLANWRTIHATHTNRH